MSGIFTTLVLLSISTAMAQDAAANRMKIGVSFTPLGIQEVGPLTRLDGAGSLDSKGLFGVDVTLLYPITEKLSLETGLGFSRQRITSLGAVVDPAMPRIERHATLKIWELPVLARYNFSRYFYANGGALFHVDGSGENNVVDKQNGIGLQLGLGMDIGIGERWVISVSPLAKLYSAIPFHGMRYPDRVLLGGLKAGIIYTLKN